MKALAMASVTSNGPSIRSAPVRIKKQSAAQSNKMQTICDLDSFRFMEGSDYII